MKIGIFATGILLTGCNNPNDNIKDINTNIEIKDDRFEKILKKYIKNSHNIKREDEEYISENIEIFSKEVIEQINSEILKTVNKDEKKYIDVEYKSKIIKPSLKPEYIKLVIQLKTVDNNYVEIEANSDLEEGQKYSIEQLVDAILQLEKLTNSEDKEFQLLMESGRVETLLYNTKILNDILENSNIKYNNKKIELEGIRKEKEELEI